MIRSRFVTLVAALILLASGFPVSAGSFAEGPAGPAEEAVLPSDEEPAQEVRVAGGERETVGAGARGPASTPSGSASAAPATPSASRAQTAPASNVVSDAPSPNAVQLPGFRVPDNLQGDNYCGQYAMTSILNAMGGNVDFRQVYAETNPAGIFTAPTTVIEYLNRVGCTASLRNHATIGEITAKLDSGKPVMVLVNCNGTPHWVAVSGYRKDAAGNPISFKLCDSVWGVNGPGGVHEMPADEFGRIWSNPLGSGVMGSLADYGSLMVDISSYDPSRVRTTPIFSGTFGTSYEDSVAGGINDVVGGFRSGSPTSMVSGAGRLVTAVPATVLTVPGRGIRNGGSAVLDDAGDRFGQGGFINRTLGAGEYALGGVMYGAGATLNAGGNLISATGNALGNGTKKLGNGVSRLWHWIAD